ncbi:MAG: hypothetical protein HY245_00295, partial [Rhizobiales bacterium]|nr:hypothetical protein [Hyphomicrobiales bacterium]
MSLWRMILTAVQLVGVRFGGAAIGLASQILLARLLPQADVGVIFLGMSAAAIVSQLVTGGYPVLALTCLPRYHALGRKSLVKAFHAAFWHDAMTLMALAAVVGGFAVVATPLDPALRTAIVFGLVAAPGASLIRINGATANSLRRYSLSYVPDFLFRPGLLLLFLVMAWLAGFALTVERVLWAFILCIYGVALAQALLMGRNGAVPPPFATAKRNAVVQLRPRAAS